MLRIWGNLKWEPSCEIEWGDLRMSGARGFEGATSGARGLLKGLIKQPRLDPWVAAKPGDAYGYWRGGTSHKVLCAGSRDVGCTWGLRDVHMCSRIGICWEKEWYVFKECE
jgi:hypothetical protein